MSSASGYMGCKMFSGIWSQIFGVLCSKCCVSWRVNIYRVNKFRVMSCQNSACQRVHAMSWPPWDLDLRVRPALALSRNLEILEFLHLREQALKTSFSNGLGPNSSNVSWTWAETESFCTSFSRSRPPFVSKNNESGHLRVFEMWEFLPGS